MLIINSQIKNYSIGHYLVEGSVQGIEATRKAWNDVKCDHVAKISPETRLNIIELDSYNVSFSRKVDPKFRGSFTCVYSIALFVFYPIWTINLF